MSAIVFTNVHLFDGSGAPRFAGELRVQDNTIVELARGGQQVGRGDARLIDGQGGTLMPGLTDVHAHLALGSTVEQINKPGDRNDAQTALLIAHCGRVMLDHGFTSAYSGGSGSMLAEVAARQAFDAGWVPGPRLRTSSFERVPGGPMGLQTRFPGRAVREPQPAEVAAFVAEAAAAGVDAVKFLLNGVSAFDAGSNQGEQFHEAEIAAAADMARRKHVWLTAHCYTAESIRMAVHHGFRVLYHCTYADEAALDAMEQHKDRLFVGLAPGIVEADLLRGPSFGVMASEADRREQADAAERIRWVGRELRRRGIRNLPGGDYGFPWNPVGGNARDLALFVEWFGHTPAEVLHAATALGGEVLAMPERLGRLANGYLADLLLVDGDPTADIGLLGKRDKLRVIMKDGRLHRCTL
ncbi:MAG: amidohydrolase family protein [Burkholderiales bacterium]|nr:amidohydrolase family protein [Burkholderiales bacterium]